MTDILLFIAISLFAFGMFKLTVYFIIPRYFLRRHKLVFDTSDEKVFYAIFQICKSYHVVATYDETDDGISIVRFVTLLWKEKKIMRLFREIENLDII